MSYVLYNGHHYIATTETSGLYKTTNILEAKVFTSTQDAKNCKLHASKKTSGYGIYNLETGLPYLMSQNRIIYPVEDRQKIYVKYNGRCALCGRPLEFSNMTLDHIKPLSRGGKDCLENIQATCMPCNTFKGNIKPDDFMQRITEVYLYQMEKRNHNSLLWRITREVLERLA